MNVSPGRTPLALSFILGLVCLGLVALLTPGDSAVKAQGEKVIFVGKNLSPAQLEGRNESPPGQARQDLTADPAQNISELTIDDGSIEAAAGVGGGGTVTGVNRLTPTSYPATITSVLIFFPGQQGAPVNSPITLLVGTNPSGAANINNVTFSEISAAVETTNSFWTYTVPQVTINSGDFVVGFRMTHGAGVSPLAIDRTSQMARRSYIAGSGPPFSILDDAVPSVAGNLMIRALVRGQPAGCHSVSGVNPPGAAVGAQVTITGSNFTGVTAVRFANNVNAAFTVNTNTQITAAVPNGAVTGPISISKPNCPDVTTAAFTVTSACNYSINPTSQSFSASAGSGSVAVMAQQGCAWMAVSNATWITITGGANGNGNGTVNYSVAAYSGSDFRTGRITIAGRTFSVVQGILPAGVWSRMNSGVSNELRSVNFITESEGWAAGANAITGYAVGDNGVILKRGANAGGSLASVSAASFLGSELAPESIVASFGQNLASGFDAAPSLPLPTSLLTTSVVIRDSAPFAGVEASVDRLAPLFFVSPGQINFQIPPGAANGDAAITVMRDGAPVASGTARIASVAPGLFSANASGQGVAAAVVFRRRADGSESFEPVAQFDPAQNRFVPIPIDLGPETDLVFLISYGSGFRFGATATATVGGLSAEVAFIGAAPGFIGLDQANVRLSRSLIGLGEVDVVLTVDGKTANTVRIAIK